jgi:hypothetical protein
MHAGGARAPPPPPPRVLKRGVDAGEANARRVELTLQLGRQKRDALIASKRRPGEPAAEAEEAAAASHFDRAQLVAETNALVKVCQAKSKFDQISLGFLNCFNRRARFANPIIMCNEPQSVDECAVTKLSPALRRLRLLLSAHAPAAATAALDTAVRAGAVPLLARLLQRGCVENQIEAAWCLTNVSAAGAHELPRVATAAPGLAKTAAGGAHADLDEGVDADQLHPALIAAPFLINLLSSTDALLQVLRFSVLLRHNCLSA